MKLEHLRINQILENVFEDVTALGRVLQHPVVQVIIRVVGLAYLLKTSSFILLLLLSNLNNESTCSSLKEYYFLVHDWVKELPPLAGWGLKEDYVSVASVSILLAWKDVSGARLIDFRV